MSDAVLTEPATGAAEDHSVEHAGDDHGHDDHAHGGHH